LLVHVLDASNPHWQRQRHAVESILHELQLDASHRLAVFNKSDRMVPEAAGDPDALYVSAKTGAGLNALRGALIDASYAVTAR
jgi:GTP-binding protein HflX